MKVKSALSLLKKKMLLKRTQKLNIFRETNAAFTSQQSINHPEDLTILVDNMYIFVYVFGFLGAKLPLHTD